MGVSGGIDSAVCAALATRALGPDRVVAVLMPEADSDPSSTERGRELCDQLGLKYEVEDIAPALAALGCYRRRDAAIRRVFPSVVVSGSVTRPVAVAVAPYAAARTPTPRRRPSRRALTSMGPAV